MFFICRKREAEIEKFEGMFDSALELDTDDCAKLMVCHVFEKPVETLNPFEVKINKLFSDKKQFTCSIRTRHNLMQTNPRDTAYMITLLKSFLVNSQLVFKHLPNLPQSAQKPVIGTVIIKINYNCNQSVF